MKDEEWSDSEEEYSIRYLVSQLLDVIILSSWEYFVHW